MRPEASLQVAQSHEARLQIVGLRVAGSVVVDLQVIHLQTGFAPLLVQRSIYLRVAPVVAWAQPDMLEVDLVYRSHTNSTVSPRIAGIPRTCCSKPSQGRTPAI